PPVNRQDLAARWVSYALQVWRGDMQEAVLWTIPPDRRALTQIRQLLRRVAGEASAAEIEQTLGGIDRFLGRDFFRWHCRLYRDRPRWWGLAGGGKSVLV